MHTFSTLAAGKFEQGSLVPKGNARGQRDNMPLHTELCAVAVKRPCERFEPTLSPSAHSYTALRADVPLSSVQT